VSGQGGRVCAQISCARGFCRLHGLKRSYFGRPAGLRLLSCKRALKIGGDTTLPASLRALVAGLVGERGALGAVPLISPCPQIEWWVGGVIGRVLYCGSVVVSETRVAWGQSACIAYHIVRPSSITRTARVELCARLEGDAWGIQQDFNCCQDSVESGPTSLRMWARVANKKQPYANLNMSAPKVSQKPCAKHGVSRSSAP
jgi:hypothetical protein